MNFFEKLFSFLFHKNHIITKKIHTLGAVLVTTCVISLVILGVNGFATSIYAATNQEEQNVVAAENESRELEDLTIEEEDLIASCNAITDDMIQKYNQFRAKIQADKQAAAKTPKKMEKESVALSAAAAVNSKELISVSPNEVSVTPNRDPIVLTKSDYDVLLRIVEAEVGTEDLETRMMIGNVVINRMLHKYYPDTVEEVVFQNNGKVYQFSPIKDGRYFEIKVTQKTIEAVANVLAGYDNSDGALAFVNREITSAKMMEWFDNNLIFVKKYGVVEYFRF